MSRRSASVGDFNCLEKSRGGEDHVDVREAKWACLARHRPAPWLSSANNHLFIDSEQSAVLGGGGAGVERQQGKTTKSDNRK